MTINYGFFCSDGILLGSDSMTVRQHDNEFSVDTAEFDNDKVSFNRSRTIAVACAGKVLPDEFVQDAMKVVEENWDSKGLRKECEALWESYKQNFPLGIEQTSMMFFSAPKKDGRSAYFGFKGVRTAHVRGSRVPFGLSNGNDGNPAYFLSGATFQMNRNP